MFHPYFLGQGYPNLQFVRETVILLADTNYTASPGFSVSKRAISVFRSMSMRFPSSYLMYGVRISSEMSARVLARSVNESNNTKSIYTAVPI
jgi:hypothetical protein